MENRCRLCLYDRNLIDLFHECILETDELRRFIYDASGVQVQKSDCITKKVCRRCCNVSIKLHKFRKTAIANDKWLREQYMQRCTNERNICEIKEEWIDLDDDELGESNVTDITVPSCSTASNVTASRQQNQSCSDNSVPVLLPNPPCIRPPVLARVSTVCSSTPLRISTIFSTAPVNSSTPANKETNTPVTFGEKSTQTPVSKNQTATNTPAEITNERVLRSSIIDNQTKKRILRSEVTVNGPKLSAAGHAVTSKPNDTPKRRTGLPQKQVARKSTTPRVMPSLSSKRKRNHDGASTSNDDSPPRLDCAYTDDDTDDVSKKRKPNEIIQNGFSGNSLFQITESLLSQLLKGCKSADRPALSKKTETETSPQQKKVKLRYKCSYCSEKVPTRIILQQHVQQHPVCVYCRARKKNSLLLMNHMKICRNFHKKVPKVSLEKVDRNLEVWDKYMPCSDVKIENEEPPDITTESLDCAEPTDITVDEFTACPKIELEVGDEPIELNESQWMPTTSEKQPSELVPNVPTNARKEAPSTSGAQPSTSKGHPSSIKKAQSNAPNEHSYASKGHSNAPKGQPKAHSNSPKGQSNIQKKQSKKKMVLIAKKKKKYMGAQKFCCPFCKLCVTQLLRHLRRSHYDEPEVANLMLLPLGSVERIELLTKLKGRGMKFLEADPSLYALQRRPPKNRLYFYPCPLCTGYYSKHILTEHYKKCANVEVVPDDLEETSSDLIDRFMDEANMVMQERVVPYLKDTVWFNILKNDRYLLRYASFLSMKFQNAPHPEFNTKVINPLRHLSHFFRELKFVKPMLPNMGAIFDAEIFFDIVVAIKHMHSYSVSFKNSFEKVLKDFLDFQIQTSIIDGDEGLQTKLHEYLDVHLQEFRKESTWRRQKN